jgi:hypothetical protein
VYSWRDETPLTIQYRNSELLFPSKPPDWVIFFSMKTYRWAPTGIIRSNSRPSQNLYHVVHIKCPPKLLLSNTLIDNINDIEHVHTRAQIHNLQLIHSLSHTRILTPNIKITPRSTTPNLNTTQVLIIIQMIQWAILSILSSSLCNRESPQRQQHPIPAPPFSIPTVRAGRKPSA